MRSPSELIAFALVPAMTGCAFSDGSPWAEAEVTLTAAFDPPQERTTAEGWLATSSDYALADLRVVIELDAISVRLSAEGGPTQFDPANPPPGYSLCHNGHCHSADGELVPYEEIEAELVGGATATALTLGVTDAPLVLERQAGRVALSECPNQCWLDRGDLSGVDVRLTRVTIEAVVHDLRTGTSARLPKSTPIAANVVLELLTSAPIEETIGPGEAIGIDIHTEYNFAPSAFDGIDFGVLLAGTETSTVIDLSETPAFVEALTQNLDSAEQIEVRTTRHD